MAINEQTHPNPSTKNLRRSKVYLSLFIFSLILIAMGLMLLRPPKIDEPATLPKPNTTITSSSAEPNESKLSKNVMDSYTVPKDMPRTIIVPKQNISGIIQNVGIDSSNTIIVPSNIHFAGWYTGSSKPGDKGLSIVNGHVSGRSTKGIFSELEKIKKDDYIFIEFGDLSTRTFRVFDVVEVDEVDASFELFKQATEVSNQLNLITCGGIYDREKQTYSRRIIIKSTLADSVET